MARTKVRRKSSLYSLMAHCLDGFPRCRSAVVQQTGGQPHGVGFVHAAVCERLGQGGQAAERHAYVGELIDGIGLVSMIGDCRNILTSNPNLMK